MRTQRKGNPQFWHSMVLRWSVLLLLLVPVASCEKARRSFRTIVTEPQKTGITTREFVDEKRNRPLVTEVWYPIDSNVEAVKAAGIWIRCDEARNAPISTSQSQYPLILFSHGNGGDRLTNAWLAEVLASNGYIVAAMDHYGNTWNNKIPELFVKPWERPKDVSFVIEALLKDSTIGHKINPKQIGFAGYSLGGTTGIWIAGGKVRIKEKPRIDNTPPNELPKGVSQEVIDRVNFEEANLSYHDPRVSAVFVMAPALARLFEESSLKQIKIPVGIIAAEADQIAPLEQNAKIFAKNISRAKLIVLQGKADHFVFLNKVTIIGKRLLDVSLCDDDPSVDRYDVHKRVGKLAVEFFDKNLR